MSSINFRLYGDQIYGMTSKYLTEYISPEILKEDFTTQFKAGKLSYENISTKKTIQINSQISLDNLNIQKIYINIPNETENLSLYLDNMKVEISLNEINDNEIEKMIINERKELIDKFIDFVIKKIEKKESSKSFIEGLIENFVNRAINGLSLDLNNIELVLKYKKFRFCFLIEKISYSEENGIKLNNVSLLYEDNLDKKEVINKFSINVEINPKDKINEIEKEKNDQDNKNEDNNEEKNNEENNNENKEIIKNNEIIGDENKGNIINVMMSNFELELNQNTLHSIMELLDFFNNIEYKKIFIRYKKLIQFHRPKEESQNSEVIEDNENNIKSNSYMPKWYYAIKTVLKLQKYIGNKKDYILDLIESSQIKITKKYIKNNSDIENILIPTEINLLKSTKEKVEEKLLENKKGGGLTKAFSFFFGGGGDDEKKELTEEEKEELFNIYKDDYITKYLLGLNDDEIKDNNPLKDKLSKFMNNVHIKINVEKIELILININEKTNNNKCNLFIKEINLNFNLNNKNYDFEFNINDIGTLLNESLFSERIEDMNYLIQIKKHSNSEMVKLNLGFKNISLNEEIFIFILSYFYSLKFPNKNKIFHEVDLYSKINKKEISENNDKLSNENEDENLSIFNNYSISHIPSLSLVNSDDNKIEFNLKDYSFNKNLLSFTLNISDSFGTILDDYSFNINREQIGNKNKIIFYLEEPLNIILSKKSSFFIFITYLKIKTIHEKIIRKSNNEGIIENEIIEKDKNKEEDNINLFCFNYVEHKNVDFDFNNIQLDILLNDINIEINEKKCKTVFSIQSLILKYENKDLKLSTEKIEINADYSSTIVLYFLDFRPKNFEQYEKVVENYLDISNDDIDNKNIEQLNLDNKINDNNNNIITTNYNIQLSDIITSLNLEIDSILLSLKIEDNIVYINLNNIKGNNNIKDPNIINISFDNGNLYVEKCNDLQEKFNILIITKPIYLNYLLDKELVQLKIDSPSLNIFSLVFKSIFKDLKYLLDQINMDIIICKTDINIINPSIRFNTFNILLNLIYISNFDGKTTDTFFLKLKDISIQNEENINIFEQKELNLNYTMKSKTEDYIYFKFSDIKINISQKDINNIFSLPEENQNEEQNDAIYKINNMNLESKNSESLIMFEDEKNNNKNIEDVGQNEKINSSQKDYCLLIEGEMHNFNIDLCLDDYTKKTNLNISNILINAKSANIKNEENNVFEKSLEYRIIVDRIILKYFDDYNNEIIILNYNREQKRGIKQNLNENNNQIEIVSEKNKTKININKNEIIIRIDCFLLLYYFIIKALPKNNNIKLDSTKQKNIDNDNNLENNNNIDNNMSIEINFNKTKFQLQTSFDAKENITLSIEEFCISYNLDENKFNDSVSYENELYSTNINIKLGCISSSIISENKSRELFYTKNEFLLVKFRLNDKNLNLHMYLGSLIISVSYQDILCILKSYIINKILIENINSLSKVEAQNKGTISALKTVSSIVEDKNSFNIKAKLIFNKIDFTLIDNSYGSYQPFLTGSLNKISLNYNQPKIVEFNFNLLLSSYNYISCTWEPIVENLLIKLVYTFNFCMVKYDNNINIDINEIIMNLSDMSISSTLIILQHWLEKFPMDSKKYFMMKLTNNNVIQFNKEVNQKVKISNHTIINYTGMNLNIKYNKKEFKLLPDSKLELEYIPDWDFSKLGPKNISVSVIEKNIDKTNEFNILIEKLGVREHYYENYSNYLIAENTLSKDRKINISIYSPLIIKNKTFDNLQIKIINEAYGNSFILLKSNEIIGIPFYYYNKDTSFSLYLINKNLDDATNLSQISFNLKDFIECSDENETFSTIPFGDKVFHMKLIKKLNNLKEILITFQYSIVNCLPCDIVIENQKEKKSINIKKFTQHFIDFYSESDAELIFKIKIGEQHYYSVNTKYFKMAEKNEGGNHYFTTFYDINKSKSFKLSIQYNKSKNTNTLIIYAESILYNDSGIDFDIISKSGNSPLCFNVGNKFYLISSQIDDIKKVWIQLKNERFISNRITLSDIIEANPFYKLNIQKNDYNLNLIIKSMMSYISIRNNPNFKENIMTMIYKIYPICRITNLLSSKNIIICEENNKNNYVVIKSLKAINFNFFDKGKNITLLLGFLNLTDNKCSPFVQFKLTTYGIFPFCIENTLFNIEVKESSINGIRDIFIVETTFVNAKIIIENLTKYNLTIYQGGYERFSQSISQNEKQILRIYDQNNNYFIVKNKENNKSYKFNFISFIEEEYKNRIDDIVFIKESNGMKMKLRILNKNYFNKINDIIFNLNLKIKIENIILSVIADNEFKNKKLRNYQRNELLLLKLSKFKIEYKLENHSGLFENNKNNMKLFLDSFSLYNQITKFGKFSLVCQNISTPIALLNSEILNYSDKSISKINNFGIEMGKLKLNIDPEFIEEVVNFFENILYRMEIINYNVDEIFLHRNSDLKIKKQFENYQKENSICYGTNIFFPEIDIKFQLTEIGLGKLLIEKVNCSDFFIWLGYGLVGKEHEIFLNKPLIKAHLGSFNSLIQKIILIYKEQASSEIINIGLKGLWGQIQHLFINRNKTSKNCTDVQKSRLRPPRAFYGKYKYFKNYEEDDAVLFDKLENKYNFEKYEIFFNELIKEEKYIYLFTNIFLFVFVNISYDIISKIEYASIDKVINNEENVIIYLNEKGKIKNKVYYLSIICQDSSTAEEITKLLNNKYKYSSSFDNF